MYETSEIFLSDFAEMRASHRLPKLEVSEVREVCKTESREVRKISEKSVVDPLMCAQVTKIVCIIRFKPHTSPPYRYPGSRKICRSSQRRKYRDHKRLSTANWLLSYDFFFKVIHVDNQNEKSPFQLYELQKGENNSQRRWYFNTNVAV